MRYSTTVRPRYAAWLWRNSAGSRRTVLLIALGGIAATALNLLTIWLTKRLIDIASGGTAESIASPALLRISSLILIGAYVLKILVSIWMKRKSAKGEIVLRDRLRSSILDKILRARYKDRERYHSAAITGRLDNDLPEITLAIVDKSPRIFTSLTALAAAGVYLFVLSPGLAITVLALTPLMMTPIYGRMGKVKRMTGAIRDTSTRIETFIQESLRNTIVIKAFETERECGDNLLLLQSDLEKEVARKTDYATVSSGAIRLTFAAGYLVAFLWGVGGLARGEISFGTMAAFLQLANMIQRPLTRLGGDFASMSKLAVAIDRISELEKIPVEEKEGTLRLENPAGVRIENLTHTYSGPTAEKDNEGNEASPSFTALSYDFAPGSMTAVTGPTGTGKTTLLKLLSAILEPDSGRVTIYSGGKEYGGVGMIRGNISFVPQGRSLMAGTIRSNLLAGNREASADLIEKALYTAVAEFVHELPEGLDTRIGENGSGLSEGEAQRIAIARALLRDSRIMILDEPTSALDRSVGDELVKRLRAEDPSRTIIIVTHSRQVIDSCDAVLDMRRPSLMQ